jgi:tryptophan halogenase
MSRPIDTVAVVGRDAAVWLSALGLQLAFGRIGVKVKVVELPSLLSDVDVYVALPTLAALHRVLNLDHAQVLAACQGVYAMGQRFSNWSAGKAPFIHAYDTQPIGVNNVDMVQYWVKARSEGLAVEFDQFSLGASMARAGRVILDGDLSETFSRPAHACQLSAFAYAGYMKQRAIRAGVSAVTGQLAGVAVEEDRIASVTLADGSTVEADLFVDATGAEAALIGALPGSGFESWSQWLACDRLLAASGPPLDPVPAFSEIGAFRAGWLGLYPLRDRTAVLASYDSRLVSDADMLEGAAVLSGLKLRGEAVVSAIAPGCRPRPWIGNCVAIGDGAITLDSLDALPLHVIHTGISRLVAMFPLEAERMVEARVYNAGMASHAGHMRDFQIAHYRLNQRREPFWERAREMEVPKALAYKLALFAGRGEIALYDDETFQAPNWTTIFIGHGLIPKTYAPQVDMLPRDEQIEQMQRMLRFVAEEVKDMPTLQSHLAPAAPSRIGNLFQ